MTAEEFEERLGAFLRFTRSLPDTAQYPTAGLYGQSTDESVIRRWFGQAETTTKEVMEAIYGSLHDLFGSSRIDSFGAKSAYGPLLSRLGSGRFVLATTNYDIAGEVALEELGQRPYAGLDASWSSGPQELHFDDIYTEDSRRTPVLHLHGRVGWYRARDGRVLAAAPEANYLADLGTPVLLLPDPTKVYDDVVSEAIWQQFSTALGQATRVLVLGHSLNDPQLAQALHAVPAPQLGISIHAQKGATQDHWIGAQVELLDRLGHSPHVIPMDFGVEPCADEQRFREFLQGDRPQYQTASEVRPLLTED